MLKSGISNAEYHADKSHYSSSQIVEFSRNPGKFRAGLTRQTKQTESQLLGSVAHKLILEPKDFDREYAVMPDYNLRTKAGKEAAQEFIESHHNLTIVQSKIFDQASDMASSTLCDPTAKKLLENTAREQSGYFTCPETGLPLKFRPDAHKRDILIDIKTAKDGSIEGFKKAIDDWNYHWQAWHYKRGMETLIQSEYKFIWIVIEKDPPYGVNCYECGQNRLYQAAEEAMQTLIEMRDYLKKPIHIMEV